MKSYAQDNEDLILYSLLKDVKNGKYIDVGANDPEVYSVTKLFYDMGWTGINIEPLDDAFKRLQEKRINDINLHCGLDKEHRTATMHFDGMGTTFSDSVVVSNNLQNKPSVEKEMYTLSEIFEKYCKDWKAIHFCKIDVEGYEKNVLEGIKDWEVFRPWVFCIESTLPGTNIPCHEQWEYILKEHDYKLTDARGINRYYVDARMEEQE